jgi:hypothetical protein
MLALFIKILLWFVAIRYGFVLLKEIHGLRRYSFLHALIFISLTILLAIHHNFFHIIIKSSNYQILKLVCCILFIRVPVVFLRGLLIGTLHLTVGKEDAVKLSRAGWYPIRAANHRTVTNGISLPKTEGKLIWALMLLLLLGNGISHHIMLSIIIASAFYICKIAIRKLKSLKIC